MMTANRCWPIASRRTGMPLDGENVPVRPEDHRRIFGIRVSERPAVAFVR